MSDTETKIIQKRQVHASNVVATEYARNSFLVVPEYGTKLEEMFREEYWAMASHMLKCTDHIEVMAEDGSWYAEFIVLNSRQGWVKVGLINHKEFGGEAVEPVNMDAYTVVWRGPKRKWSIERKSDNQIMKENFEDKTDAMAWIVGNKRAIAA